jgi:aspartate/methionine/tyrosine aminotransferase
VGITRLAPPDGAFYVYADVSDFTSDSLGFCERLLADTGLAIAPGVDFDTARGGSFVRLSFAGPAADITEAQGHLRQYAANRDTLLAGLRRVGITRLAPPDGAFYVYADVSDFTSESLRFCERLLADTGLAIAPGVDFDTARGGSFVRLSFAGPAADIAEAVRRLEQWLPRQGAET